MDRLRGPVNADNVPELRPDMTILEAADAMERSRGTRLPVRGPTRILGILTEEDIVRKVLAQGRNPDTVRVADILIEGAPDTDEPWEDTILAEITQGKCDDCGDFSIDLVESDGLILCGDCREGLPRLAA